MRMNRPADWCPRCDGEWPGPRTTGPCPQCGCDPPELANLDGRWDVVQRAKQALEGVTDGPWEAQEWDSHANGDRGCGILAGIGMQQRGIAYVGLYWWNPQAQAEADAEFIAAARTLVPELIAEVERLNGLLASSADEIKSLRKRLADKPKGLRGW